MYKACSKEFWPGKSVKPSSNCSDTLVLTGAKNLLSPTTVPPVIASALWPSLRRRTRKADRDESVRLLTGYYHFCNRVFWEASIVQSPASGWLSIN